MKLTEKEKAARRAAFRALSPEKKLDHIWTYYKWPILLTLIAAIVLGNVVHRRLTQKEPVLYLAMVNVAVGEDLEGGLTLGYLAFTERNPQRQDVYFYRDLYLSEDADTLNHEYAYASRMKVMGALQAQKLDLFLMNQEAYDLLSGSGWLLELSALSPEATLVSNEVVVEDNVIDWQLGEAKEHTVVTETAYNAIAVNDLPLFADAGFDGNIYLGVAANTPRSELCADYIRYLCTGSK